MRKTKKKRSLWGFAGVFLFAAAFLIDLRLQQLTLEFSEPQINRIALETASKAVSKALSENGGSFVTYGELSGEVSILQTDMEAVNRFMSAVSEEMCASLASLEDRTVELPIGTLLKSAWLSGRGPNLSCRIVPYGQVNLYTASHFESCGINQTRHRILLNVRLELSALTALQSSAVVFENDYILSETILTGKVPESYTYLLMEERELLSEKTDGQNLW